jgi:hypothetical protein
LKPWRCIPGPNRGLNESLWFRCALLNEAQRILMVVTHTFGAVINHVAP